jgi:hypothetical protein
MSGDIGIYPNTIYFVKNVTVDTFKISTGAIDNTEITLTSGHTLETYRVFNQDNMAVPYKYAEERYYRPIASYETFGIVKIKENSGLTIENGILSATQAKQLSPPKIDFITAGVGNTAAVKYLQSEYFGGVGPAGDTILYSLYWKTQQGVTPNSNTSGLKDQAFGTGTMIASGITGEDTEYWFTVGARSEAYKTMVFSPEVSYTTPVIPLEPFTISSTVALQTEITVYWNECIGATSYAVSCTKANNGYEPSASQTPSVGAAREATFRGLTPGTTYYFYVKASKAKTASVYAGPDHPLGTKTLAADAGAPSGITVVGSGLTQCTVTFTKETGNTGSGHYWYYRNVEATPPTNQIEGTPLTDNTFVFTETGLTQNTTYYYWVRTSNVDGVRSAWSPVGIGKTWTTGSKTFTSDVNVKLGEYDVPTNVSGNFTYKIVGAGGQGGGGGFSLGTYTAMLLGILVSGTYACSSSGAGGGSGGYITGTITDVTANDILAIRVGQPQTQTNGSSATKGPRAGQWPNPTQDYWFPSDGLAGGPSQLWFRGTCHEAGGGGGGGVTRWSWQPNNAVIPISADTFRPALGGTAPTGGVAGEDTVTTPWNGQTDFSNEPGNGGNQTNVEGFGDGGKGGKGASGIGATGGSGVSGQAGCVILYWTA